MSPRTPSRGEVADDIRERLLIKAFAQEKKLRKLLHRFTNNQADTEELLQELYVRLLQMSTQELPEIDSIGALITTTAYNLGCDFFRRQRVISLHLVAALDSSPRKGEPEDWLTTERELDLARIVDSMPQRRAQVYTLNKIFGLRQKEISRQLGISINTVEQHLARASHFIAKALREGADVPNPSPPIKSPRQRAITDTARPTEAQSADANTPSSDTAAPVKRSRRRRKLTD